MGILEKPICGYKLKGWLAGLLYACVMLLGPIVLLYVLFIQHLTLLVAMVIAGLVVTALLKKTSTDGEASKDFNAWELWEALAFNSGPYLFIWVFAARDLPSVLVLTVFCMINIANNIRGYRVPLQR